MNWIPASLLKIYRRPQYRRLLDLPKDASDEDLWGACLRKADVDTAEALVRDGLIPRTRDGADARQKLLHEWLDGLVAQSTYTTGSSLRLLPQILNTGADPYARPCWEGATGTPTLRDKRSFLDRLVDDAPARTLYQAVATGQLQLDGRTADGTPYVFKVIDRKGNPGLNWDVVNACLKQGVPVTRCDKGGVNLLTRAFQEGPEAFGLMKRWVETLMTKATQEEWQQARTLHLSLVDWVGQTHARWDEQLAWIDPLTNQAGVRPMDPEASPYDIGPMIHDALYLCGKMVENRGAEGRTFVQAWIHGGAWNANNLNFILDPNEHEAMIWPAWRARDHAGNTYWHTLFSRAEIWNDRHVDIAVTQKLVAHLKEAIPALMDEPNHAGQTPRDVFEQAMARWPEAAAKRALSFWREQSAAQATPTRTASRPRLRT